jgi:hypothetical protein
MTTFLALYHGRTIGEAQIIGISADAHVVHFVANHLLEAQVDNTKGDSVSNAIQQGRNQALRLIAGYPNAAEQEAT